MDSHDILQRFVFEHEPVRGEYVHLDATWAAVLARHDYPAPLRILLGEMMAAAALLSATLKFNGSLIMQLQGGGPVSLAVVECTDGLTMRATAKWRGALQDGGGLRQLVGNAGHFAITISPQDGGQAYQGIVALEGNNMAEILARYMRHSEQLETCFQLTADGERAAGMLLQRMPGEAGEDPDAWNRAERLASTLTDAELIGLQLREILHRLYHEEDLRLFDPLPVAFGCHCTRQRVAGVLRMLGYDEVKKLLAEHGAVEADCEFCNQHYRFDAVDTEQVFASEILAAPAQGRH
ncbi:MAG TPA: Hsp33 family molecular chaperone HslO [Betaproteobacteria bacterium]|nr:Hsp33 family molecular chaperone HslO [Betaproteobacteria bacterium]